MGDMLCMQAASGEVVWRVDVNKTFAIEGQPTRMPIWGLSAAPLIFEDLVILHIGGRDGACLVALEKATGKLRWKALDDRASYSAPVLMSRGQRMILIAWTGDSLSGLQPDSGDVLWSISMPPSRMPIGIATPIIDGDRVYVTSFYDGSLMAEVSADGSQAKTLWRKVGPDERRTEALHSIISTPVMFDDHIYGVDSYGELRCLKAETGERVWEDLTLTPKARWSTVHFVKHGGQYWMLNERGELVLGELSPQGLKEIGRAPLIQPTLKQLRQRGGVVWSHPAFANRCVFARNDDEVVCASLAVER
jgi:outer membrane protein assembly factor BamB